MLVQSDMISVVKIMVCTWYRVLYMLFLLQKLL